MYIECNSCIYATNAPHKWHAHESETEHHSYTYYEDEDE